ncbi:hypothetical protein AAVH_05926 [Aphelenchoides avenae]|nr:hypothetical protein AAVH_05926 [Aphelenchus avenae]
MEGLKGSRLDRATRGRYSVEDNPSRISVSLQKSAPVDFDDIPVVPVGGRNNSVVNHVAVNHLSVKNAQNGVGVKSLYGDTIR